VPFYISRLCVLFANRAGEAPELDSPAACRLGQRLLCELATSHPGGQFGVKMLQCTVHVRGASGDHTHLLASVLDYQHEDSALVESTNLQLVSRPVAVPSYADNMTMTDSQLPLGATGLDSEVLRLLLVCLATRKLRYGHS
jgi:hypothetical protein